MIDDIDATDSSGAVTASTTTTSSNYRNALVAFSFRNPFHDALRDDTRWFPLADRRVQIAQRWRADGRGGTRLGFGASVYDASVLLALFVEANRELVRGRRVLELGCGPGLAGIAASIVGAARVLLTDGDEGSVALAQHNAELNGLTPTCGARRLLWGDADDARALDEEEPAVFDVVLGADIVACPYADAFEALLTSLRALVRKHTLLLLAYKRRHGSENVFFAQLEKEFEVEEVPACELHHDFQQGDIALFKARWKNP